MLEAEIILTFSQGLALQQNLKSTATRAKIDKFMELFDRVGGGD